MRTAFIFVALVALLAVAASAEHKHSLKQVDTVVVPMHESGLPQVTYEKAVKILRQMLVETYLNKTASAKTAAFAATLKVRQQPPNLKGLPCYLCKKAVGWLIDHANDWACDAAFDAIAISACEAAGLGPEDPWADICSVALIKGCSILFEHIEDHEDANPAGLCADIDLC